MTVPVFSPASIKELAIYSTGNLVPSLRVKDSLSILYGSYKTTSLSRGQSSQIHLTRVIAFLPISSSSVHPRIRHASGFIKVMLLLLSITNSPSPSVAAMRCICLWLLIRLSCVRICSVRDLRRFSSVCNCLARLFLNPIITYEDNAIITSKDAATIFLCLANLFMRDSSN